MITRILRKKFQLPIMIFLIIVTIYTFYVWPLDKYFPKLPDFVEIKEYPALSEHVTGKKPSEVERRLEIHEQLNSNQLYVDNIRGISIGEIQKIVGGLIPKDEILHVHVVPFSHVDPGWLQTYDEYTASTNQILTSMLEFLTQNPDMSFIWMETVFFAHWWKTINESQRMTVKKLLDIKSLDLLSGSWVMTDEAVAHYWSMIDNFVEGHQYIAESLGEKYIPTTSWSNDPFGHSSTTTYIARLAGLENFFVNRISSTLKVALGKAISLEFLWRQSWDISGSTDAFTHVLQGNHYDVLSTCGFDPSVCCRFDFLRIKKFFCGANTTTITPENVKSSAELLTGQYRAIGSLWPHNHVLVPLGDDFRFMNLEDFRLQYDNYKMLFSYINAHSKELKVKAKFSTITNYFKEVSDQFKDSGHKPATLVGDFFPYNDVMGTSWTGYYSTRPYQKKLDAILRNVLRAADIISVMTRLKSMSDSSSDWLGTVFAKLRSARRKLALFQHHDAITGTSRLHVATDYVEKLKAALRLCNEVIVDAITYLTDDESLKSMSSADNHVFYNKDGEEEPLKVIRLNSNSSTKRLMIFNPQPYEMNDLIRLVTNQYNIIIEDANGDLCQYQINPYFHFNGSVDNILFEVHLRVALRPLSLQNFLIRLTNRTKATNLAHVYCTTCSLVPNIFKAVPLNQSTELHMENGFVKTYHDMDTGFLTAVDRLGYGLSSINISFASYSPTGSGHYIFAPFTSFPDVYNATSAKIFVIKGTVSQVVHSVTRLIYHKARMLTFFNTSAEYVIDIENFVDMKHTLPSDFVMNIHTQFKPANESFYTDLNGFQIMKRRFVGSAPEKNYYPITSSVSMIDGDSTAHFVVLTGQPHGATVRPNGQIEIMLDRTAVTNDNKGIPEVLDRSPPSRTNFRLLLEERGKNETDDLLTHSESIRRHMFAMQYRPLTFFGDKNSQDGENDLRDITLLDSSFPSDIFLINIRQLTKQFDCGLILQKFSGHTSSIGKILHNLGISKRTFWPCTLSGIRTDRNFGDINEVTMKAMDVRMFCFR